MQRIGQDWLVLQLSDDSGVALGLITALQFGPSLLLSMYGGVLADRYDKRRMLLVTQSLMGLLALALGILVATDVVALWHVFVLAFGLGAVAAIDAPMRQAFVSGDGRPRRCWPTPSASTPRSSTARGWWARRSPGCSSARPAATPPRRSS